MGLFDFLGGNSEKKREKTIQKAGQRLRNPHGQTQERMRFIDVLRDIGSPEAVKALLGRFTMRTPGSIVDEDEKRAVYDVLLNLGDIAVVPIVEFIHADPNIYWPLRALTEIAGERKAVEVLLSGLDASEHGYNVDMDRREQLVSNLREYLSIDAALERMIALTRDESIEIRILAIDGLTDAEDSRIPGVLVERLEQEDESQRVKSTIMDILADRRIDMSGHRARLTPQLTEGFFLDGTGIVQRR